MPISKINTTSITDNSVTAGKIVAGAVDADIAAGSIDTAQIADDAVTSAKLDTDIDIAGNLGVGVVPESGWSNTWNVAQVGLTASLSGISSGSTGRTFITDNAYNNSNSQSAHWQYQIADQASQIAMLDGKVEFRTATAGSADADITWNTAVEVDNTGNVGVGVTPTDFQNRKSLDIGLGGKVWGLTTATETGHGNNFYFDGAYKRIAASAATRHIQDGNGHTFDVVASGSANSTISWNTATLISPDGYVTKPNQPCFSATATTTNIPLATSTTVTLSSERFDVGGNLANNIFTAPVTGKYLFTYIYYVTNLDNGHTTFDCHILTSNKQYQQTMRPTAFMTHDGNFGVSGSVIADMDINDTCRYTVYVSGGSAQTDIHGDSHVSGALLF